MLRRQRLYLFVAAAFAASEILSSVLGIRFAAATLGTLYQYLDPVLLERDLTRSLYYLHSQPPLFNLFLGVVVKVFGDHAVAVFSVLFGAMALGVLLGMAWLMRRLAIPDGLNAAACLVFALSPGFGVYRYWLFYTLPVAFLLVLSAVCLEIFRDSESRGALAGFAACAGVVMLIRSAFHPLWLVGVAAALVWVVPSRRRFLLACLVPLVVVNLWFLKNLALVGSYSGSTWVGLSLTKRWPLSQREVARLERDGVVPPYWSRRPFQEPAFFMPFGFFAGDAGVHPALDAAYKANGEPNFNHRDYVRISDDLLAADVDLMRLYPDRYLRRVLTSLMLFLQPGPNSVHFLVDYDFERVHRYREAWTYLFLGGQVERPIRMLEPPANLWMAVFPLLLVVAARGRPRAVYLYLGLTVLWLTAVANLVEIGENDRMRWEVEPLLVILLATGASRLLLLLGRLKRA